MTNQTDNDTFTAICWPLLTTAISLGRRRRGMLLDQGQEVVLPGTDDGLNRLAVLDEVEGRHRLDLVGRGNFLWNKKQRQRTVMEAR